MDNYKSNNRRVLITSFTFCFNLIENLKGFRHLNWNIFRGFVIRAFVTCGRFDDMLNAGHRLDGPTAYGFFNIWWRHWGLIKVFGKFSNLHGSWTFVVRREAILGLWHLDSDGNINLYKINIIKVLSKPFSNDLGTYKLFTCQEQNVWFIADWTRAMINW